MTRPYDISLYWHININIFRIDIELIIMTRYIIYLQSVYLITTTIQVEIKSIFTNHIRDI